MKVTGGQEGHNLLGDAQNFKTGQCQENGYQI